MLTTVYKLTGKDVPQSLAGTSITLKVPETYPEAESLTKNGQPDVVAKFADGRIIGLQGKLRTASGKKNKDGTLVNDAAALQKIADEYLYSVQTEGTPKSIKPETKVNRVAASAGNKIFDRMATDERFRSQMFKSGTVDQADFDAYVAARDEAKAAQAPSGATEPASNG